MPTDDYGRPIELIHQSQRALEGHLERHGYTCIQFEGSVKRKLRWVENSVNRSRSALDWGAGHSFVVLFGFRIDFTIFPFPVSTA